MGIGIGGDYPLSAAVIADRAHRTRRGSLIALVFAAQGWGGLVVAIVSCIVVAGYKSPVEVRPQEEQAQCGPHSSAHTTPVSATPPALACAFSSWRLSMWHPSTILHPFRAHLSKAGGCAGRRPGRA